MSFLGLSDDSNFNDLGAPTPPKSLTEIPTIPNARRPLTRALSRLWKALVYLITPLPPRSCGKCGREDNEMCGECAYWWGK